ncbi:hypothetical protein BDF20DRAFT_872100 [Mycotypha africana]|uniref:uncharacterized protein n=1 Tax=Mycotypha africana TaxID=64632 RepID=UPI0023015B9D|nr:uncharacterized protein BDF20DRAFT_872100 [Mycotypha africana]KAI8979859.1 hypothetical protein BDF20DRAFT_872100 [Mycotypha africana]
MTAIPSASLSENILARNNARQRTTAPVAAPSPLSGTRVYQLQSSLSAKLHEKNQALEQLQLSPITRKALVQQSELIKKELNNLNQYDKELEVSEELRFKLELLTNELHTVKGSKSTTRFGGNNTNKLKPSTVKPLPPPLTSAGPTKQRSKNIKGSGRNPDIAFATEIGQNLLVEIRRLQNLLQEKEDIIKQLEKSQDDNELSYDDAITQLRKKEKSEERLQEENWNLEIANQELRDHLIESSQTIAKHNVEYAKLSKQLKRQTEQIEILKAREEKSISVIETIKARHEQESFTLKKITAQTQRESNLLKNQLQDLKAELQICQSKLAIKQSVSSRVTEAISSQSNPSIENEGNEDDHSNAAEKILATNNNAIQVVRNQAMETETLKQSLAHAHRIISNLRSSSHKEKKEKFELKKMLSDSQEIVEQQSKQLINCHCNRDHLSTNDTKKMIGKKKPIAAKRKRIGVARRAKGLTPEESNSDEEIGIEQHNSSNISTTADDEVDDIESNEYQMLDPYFGTDCNSNPHQNNMLRYNNSALVPALAMKPLSSELEANSKVEKCDIGVNTDALYLTEEQLGVVNQPVKAYRETIDGIYNTQPDSSVSQTLTEKMDKKDKMSRNSINQQQAILLSRINNTDYEMNPVTINKDKTPANQSYFGSLQASTLLKYKGVDNVDFRTAKRNKDQLGNIIDLKNVFLQRARDILSPAQIDMLIPIFNEGYTVTTAVEKANSLSVPYSNLSDEQCNPQTNINADNDRFKFDMGQPNVSVMKKTLPTTEDDPPAKTESPRITVEEGNALRGKKLTPSTAMALKEQQADESLAADTESLSSVESFSANEANEPTDSPNNNINKLLESLDDSQCKLKVAHTKTEMKQQFEIELIKQRSELILAMDNALKEQRKELETARQNDINKLKEDMEASKLTNIQALNADIESYKKEAKLTNQQMKEMLTRESANILIKRAVDEAVDATEKKHRAVLSEMIPKQSALGMVQIEVAKAIEEERKVISKKEESFERELQLRLNQMISKAEAEGIKKLAVADAIMKERKAIAAREDVRYTKEQVDLLIEAAVREAINNKKSEHALLSATKRKFNRDKEKLSAGYLETETHTTDKRAPQDLEHNYVPAIPVKRSNSTLSKKPLPSRKTPSPFPSVSTPVFSPGKPKLSETNRTDSFRLKLSKSISPHQKSKRFSIDNTEVKNNSYGSVRILETTRYNNKAYQHLKARSCMSLHSLSQRQISSTSISTISSNEDSLSDNLLENPSLTLHNSSDTHINVVMAVTQTVIGEDMFKHTRRYVGGGFSANNHKRYFWVHPYTNTLYWSTTRPGPEGNERKTKRIFVQSVASIPNNNRSGLSPNSLLISTPKRKLKITASTLERHEVWLKALTYLVKRPIITNERISEQTSHDICSTASLEYAGHQQTSNDTLNISYDALFSTGNSDAQIFDVEDSDSADSEELIDVRQCCGGKHDISTLSKNRHHNHSFREGLDE